MPASSTNYQRGISVYLGRRRRPALVLADWTFPKAVAPRETHAHAHHIEIHYTVRGTQRYEIPGRMYDLKAGDIFIAMPGERHGTGKHMLEKRRDYFIRIDISGRGRLLGLHPSLGRPIFRAMRGLRSGKYSIGTAAAAPLKEFFSRHIDDKDIREALAVGACIQFLSEMLAAIKKQRMDPPADLSPILSHIETSHERILPITDLAGRAGLSISRFREVFRTVVGMPVHDYIMRRRVERSKRLLAEKGRSITDISYQLGFSSSQYFSTVFKRYTGRSPGDYRRKKMTHARTHE
ncbi:MAG: AraC family transcriptional regulator [Spirochaetota bacterium]